MKIPVCDVNSDNFTQLWPSLLLAVRAASFVAVDTELSGLGDRRALNAKSIDDRYKALCHISQTRSIVSLGLSTFKFLPSTKKTSSDKGDNPEPNWMVQTFNITVLCKEEYVVEPEALVFLVDHGFDFNKQYSRGIPYSKQDHQEASKPGEPCIRDLLSQLIVHQIPVVFHNALVDLGFLYGNLYGPLPAALGMFLSDLTEMFAGGIYDTKYITEYVARYPASFLDYVFHRSLRDNSVEPCESCVTLTFPTYPEGCNFIGYRECAVSPRPALHAEVLQAMRGLVCCTFAAHGWCPKRRQCSKSHDIDLILDTEEVDTKKNTRSRKRKRRRGNAGNHDNKDLAKSSISTDHCDSANDMNIAEDVNECSEDICQLTSGELRGADEECTMMQDHPSGSVKSSKKKMCVDESDSQDLVNSLSEAHQQRICKQKSGGTVCPSKSSESDTNSKLSETEFSQMDTDNQECQNLNNSSTAATNCSVSKHMSNSKGHRAGFDAFMTGFAMATFAVRFGSRPSPVSQTDSGLKDWGMGELVNKVYLTAKDIPLHITKTNFSKSSKYHTEKLAKLQSLRTT